MRSPCSRRGTRFTLSPKATLSWTDMCGKSAYCWNTMFSGRLFGAIAVTSRPWSMMRPSSGTSKPAIIRSVVVFPHPLGPSSEKNSPSSIVSVTSLTAAVLPKRLLTPSSAMPTLRSAMRASVDRWWHHLTA